MMSESTVGLCLKTLYQPRIASNDVFVSQKTCSKFKKLSQKLRLKLSIPNYYVAFRKLGYSPMLHPSKW